MKFRQKLTQFMYGRRGTDEFSRFLLIVTIVLIVVSWAFQSQVRAIFSTLALACLIYSYIRILSRNIYKRQQENAKYLTLRSGVIKWLRSLRDRWRQRKEYRFFRCPSCHTLLRVPKNKGKLLLTCRKCGNRFEKKT